MNKLITLIKSKIDDVVKMSEAIKDRADVQIAIESIQSQLELVSSILDAHEDELKSLREDVIQLIERNNEIMSILPKERRVHWPSFSLSSNNSDKPN